MNFTSTSGFFPFGADPATHLARIPYGQVLGFSWEKGGIEGVSLGMRQVPACSDARGAIHRLALLALMDHSCSAAVYQALPAPQTLATIDLRCEFAAAPSPAADVRCLARTVHLDDRFAIVRAVATCVETGAELAFASSAYALGAHPGMQGKAPALAPYRPSFDIQKAQGESFEKLLGLQGEGPVWQLPFKEQLIGSLSLPSMHGGAIGAALAFAAIEQARSSVDADTAWLPLTITLQYLRAVESRLTRIETTVRKRGRRSCVISSSASQSAGKKAAYAECLLVHYATG
ncbi:MAG: hotdog domain-containing protein [Devosia sp.]